MENVLQFAKQNEAFLWRFLIVIVFAIVLLNLYLRQRLKINKELKSWKEKENFTIRFFWRKIASIYILMNSIIFLR